MATISVDRIYVGKRRRKDYGQAELEDLMNDIEENGQITPITVRPPYSEEEHDLIQEDLGHVEEPLVLVAGGRRYAAVLRLGWDFIEAYTREDPIDELKHRILELHENLKRKEMHWSEIATAKAEMLAIRQEIAAKEGKTITEGEVAKELGQSHATFSRDVKAAEAIAKTPSLKLATSRKAALRADAMEQHEQQSAARISRSQAEQAGVTDLRRRIVTGDARDFLRTVDSRSVDLILTDPPYGIDYWKGGHKMRAGGEGSSLGVSEYDDSLGATTDLIVDVVPLWVRAVRETGWIVAFAGEELSEMLHQLLSDCCGEHADYRSTQDKKRCLIAVTESSPNACRFLVPEMKDWIWYRPNSRNQSRYPELHAKNQYERIVVCNAGKARLARGANNVKIHNAEYGDERIHANQKPMTLAEELLNDFTYYGDTVLDSFFGSGVFLATAARMGRYFYGCDSNSAMLGQAVGFVSKYYQPVAKEGLKASEKRHQDKLALPTPVDTLEPVDA